MSVDDLQDLEAPFFNHLLCPIAIKSDGMQLIFGIVIPRVLIQLTSHGKPRSPLLKAREPRLVQYEERRHCNPVVPQQSSYFHQVVLDVFFIHVCEHAKKRTEVERRVWQLKTETRRGV